MSSHITSLYNQHRNQGCFFNCILFAVIISICGCNSEKQERTVYIDVTTYGAKPNDSTNDAYAISNAVRFANVCGGATLYFPNGEYNLDTVKIKK